MGRVDVDFLPKGYELLEDVTFAYLLKGDEWVGIFNANKATKETIREAALNHMNGLGVAM